MTSSLFAIVLLVVITTLWMRKRARNRTQSIIEDGVGRNAVRPLVVSRFDEMDTFLRAQRCHCGGRTDVVSEGSKYVDGVQLRVVRADCDDCSEELYFFFRLNHVLH